MRYYIVYKTTNLVNQKIYIGQHSTENLNDGYLGSGVLLQKAIKKYGRQNFIRETLEFCSEDNLSEKELEWIIKLEAVKIGYNLSENLIPGVQWEKGRIPWNKGLPKEQQPRYQMPLSKESIERLKETKKKRPYKHNSDRRKKISEKAKQRPKRNMSDKTKEKLSLVNSGKIRTEQQIENIKEGCKKRMPLFSQMRAIYQCSLDGETIKEWESISEAISVYGHGINNCLRNSNYTCRGYKWKYKNPQ